MKFVYHLIKNVPFAGFQKFSKTVTFQIFVWVKNCLIIKHYSLLHLIQLKN